MDDNDYRERMKAEIARSIREVEELLFGAEGGDGDKPIRASNEPGVHAGHRKRLRGSARRDAALSGFSDIELIELILSFFVPQKDTNVLAHKLLDKFGSVLNVLHAPTDELSKFPSMTRRAAIMLPVTAQLCRKLDGFSTALDTREKAADFFGTLYLGKPTSGIYLALLDGRFRIITIERFDCKSLPSREVVSAVYKYNAKFVFAARYDSADFRLGFGIAPEISRLKDLLDTIGAKLLDYLLFADYGYYTIGAPKRSDDAPTYIFVPTFEYARSPEFFDAVAVRPDAPE